MNENKEKIKAPWLGLKGWREENIPDEVWNNPYLQAYLERQVSFIIVAILLSMIFIFAYKYGW